MRLSDVADSRDNNFDVLRLFAASIVLVSHSFFLAGVDDPVGALTGITLGSFGVALFFGMSGFLIVKSWRYEPAVRSFTRKRFLRIMPALWVVIALTTLVMGPLVTTLSPAEYFSDPGAWRYLVMGSLLITFGGVLPGVFTHNPYPDAVNGSLWTLPIEASAYAMVAILGVIGVLRRRELLPVLLAMALVVSFVFQSHELLQNLRLYAFFLTGMTLYVWRESIVLSWRWAAVGVAVWILTFDGPLLVLTSATILPYVALVFAYRSPRSWRSVVRYGDVSYGVYIYAFPIQQLTAQVLGDAVSPFAIFAIAMPIAWLLGLMSWKLVERPALRLKRTRSSTASNTPVRAPAVTSG